MFSISQSPLLLSFLSFLLFRFLPSTTANNEYFYSCNANYALAPFVPADCNFASRAIDLFHARLATFDISADDFQPVPLPMPIALQYNTCTVYAKRAHFSTLSDNIPPVVPPNVRRETFELWGDLAIWSALLVRSCVVPRGDGGIIETAATVLGIERPIDIEMMSTAYFDTRVDRTNAVTRYNLRLM